MVDGCVALLQPADPWQLVFVSVRAKENDDVIFRDHQVQSGNHKPAGGGTRCLRKKTVCTEVREVSVSF